MQESHSVIHCISLNTFITLVEFIVDAMNNVTTSDQIQLGTKLNHVEANMNALFHTKQHLSTFS